MREKYKLLQRTISKTVNFSGVGLHSGKICNVILRPAEPDSGIVFIRNDLNTNNIITADYKHIYRSNLCTTLKAYNSNAKVLTVEHLLAAVKGNGIDNLIIDIDCQEVPILDGSSREYDHIIKKAGITEQDDKYKRFLIIKKQVLVETDKSYFKISPCDSLQIKCTVEFPKPIGIQSIKLGHSLEEIYNQVMDAKTFCYYEDIENMRKNGLAKGGSLDNAIVIKDGSVINSDFRNNSNYFVKHKTLDILGDLALMDLNIIGNISVYYPGHDLNRLVMKKIFSDYSNFSIIQHIKKKEQPSLENILAV